MLYKSKLHCPKVGVKAQTKIKIVHLPDREVQGEERERCSYLRSKSLHGMVGNHTFQLLRAS